MNIHDLIPESARKDELAAVQRQSHGEVLQPHRTKRIAKDGRIVEVMTLPQQNLWVDSGSGSRPKL
jgi:hypothetical protein